MKLLRQIFTESAVYLGAASLVMISLYYVDQLAH